MDINTLNYVNLSFINNTTSLQKASLKQTSASPIISNQRDWILSCVRFDVDISEIPLNVPLMKVIGGVTSKTITDSTVTIKYLGNYFTAPVLYIETSIRNVRDFPTIYDYQKWLDFVNTALSTAFTMSLATGFAPQLIFNPITQLVELYVSDQFIQGGPCQLFFNNPLLQYLYSFELDSDTEVSTNLDYQYRFLINNFNTLVIPPVGSRLNLPVSLQGSVVPPTLTNLYMISQNSISTNHWNSLRSIILVGSGITIKNELIPQNVLNSSNYSADNSLAILSDFLVNFSDLSVDRFIGQYLPTAEYRRIDLTGNGPLSNINLDIYWTDFIGNRYPIFLSPNTGISIKLLFEKRLQLL